MIDKKELRIDNIVYYYHIGNMIYDTIKSIYFDDEDKNYHIEFHKPFFKHTHITTEAVSPIQITEDLLLKLGFTKCFHDILNEYYYKLILNGFCIDINIYSNTLGRDYSVHIDNLCCDSVLSGDIQYLHQLQNYIYDSTKQELDISNII